MKKREANFGLRFRHWIRANPPDHSATFELKDCSHKKSFPFKDWPEAQRDWALAISSPKGALMRQVGGNGEPDYTYHMNQMSYVVINFEKGFEVISARLLLSEIKYSKRKSLTHTRAKQISTFSV